MYTFVHNTKRVIWLLKVKTGYDTYLSRCHSPCEYINRSPMFGCNGSCYVFVPVYIDQCFVITISRVSENGGFAVPSVPLYVRVLAQVSRDLQVVQTLSPLPHGSRIPIIAKVHLLPVRTHHVQLGQRDTALALAIDGRARSAQPTAAATARRQQRTPWPGLHSTRARPPGRSHSIADRCDVVY
eukprot:COSAG01_NODE_5479_length_4233_cov_30.503145_1_plen_184_part_00